MSMLNVLVVDDCEAVRMLASDWLTDKGHRVTLLTNGKDALRLLDDGPGEFNLIIFDNIMPGGPDGIQVMRQLKADHRFIGIPIVLHSGDLGEELQAEVLKLGGIFLPKDYGYEALFAFLRRLAGK